MFPNPQLTSVKMATRTPSQPPYGNIGIDLDSSPLPQQIGIRFTMLLKKFVNLELGHREFPYMLPKPLYSEPPPLPKHVQSFSRDFGDAQKNEKIPRDLSHRMAQDILNLQEEVEHDRKNLAEKETELVKCNNELNQWKEQACNLSGQIQNSTQTTHKIELENELLRRQVLDLINSLSKLEAEKGDRFRNDKELQELRVRNRDLEQQKQASNAMIEEQMARMDVEVNEERFKDQIKDLEMELQEQKKLCEFFKKNSEKLTRQVKEERGISMGLEDSEHALKHQLAELKSQFKALKVGGIIAEVPELVD